MRREFLIGAALAVVTIATPALALPAGFKAKADALMAQSYSASGPGASVVISEGGKIVYRGQRGLADIAAKRPVTAATVFRIGSITKQFSAAVVLQLAAEGKLKLSDPLSKYLPNYPNAAAITVEQLLNHTSGIQTYTAIPGWMAANMSKAFTTEQLIAEFKDQPAPSKPGEKFNYNNSGYVLVGALIEAVTGNRWSDEVRTRIAKPLGLATLDDGIRESAAKAMAKGYSTGEKGPELARAIHMSVPGAAGALIADAGDLATWGHALHHGKIVPAPYYAQMVAPTKLPDGSVEQYGFGITPESFRGGPAIGHGGGIPGFASDSLYVPDRDLFIAILTNSDSADVSQGMVMRKLAALAIDKPFVELPTVPYTAKAVEPYLGVYKFDGGVRTVSMQEGKLSVQRDEGRVSEVFAAGNNRFHYGTDDLSWFEMRRDAAGKPVMAFHRNGDDAVNLGTWTGPVPVEAAAFAVSAPLLASYAGTYSTPIGKATVALAGESLTVQIAGQPPFALKAVGPADFTVAKVGAKVRFVSAAGKISGLEILQGGRTLPGTRD